MSIPYCKKNIFFGWQPAKAIAVRVHVPLTIGGGSIFLALIHNFSVNLSELLSFFSEARIRNCSPCFLRANRGNAQGPQACTGGLGDECVVEKKLPNFGISVKTYSDKFFGGTRSARNLL